MGNLLKATLVLLLSQSLGAEEVFTIPRDKPWDTWDYPRDLINVTPEGIQVKRFSAQYNALTDASQFEIAPVGAHGQGIARTPSNPQQIDRVHDQRPDTWWRPDPSSPLDDWWVEIDLRRIVLAEKIRLVFPDTLGARPFRFFSVYTSPGLEVAASPGSIYFTRVGGTIKANTSRLVEFELKAKNPSEATGQYLDPSDELPFDLVRFIRFQVEGPLEDAALAEIEVQTAGENIALRLEDWGGQITASARSYGVGLLLNGDLNSRGGWGIEHNAGRQEGWRSAGMWFRLDMLNTFRIDRIVWLPIVQSASPWFYSIAQDRQSGWEGTTFKLSDGSPSASIAGIIPEEGNYTYEILSEINNDVSPQSWIFDLQFPPQSARLLFWHYDRRLSFGWTRALQLFVYHAEGYPARVAMTSGFIDFGAARSISRLEWDADLPAGTQVQAQTKTGNTFETVKHYFAKQGTQEVEVTEDKYLKLPKISQGRITEEIRPGTDWSDWSDLHSFSGATFLSPTPRRFLQARVFLASQDPQAMPVLRSLSLLYNPPLVANGLTGQVLPRQAPLDSLQAFRYTIWPQYSSADRGFDQVILQVPSPVQEVQSFVRGRPVEGIASQEGDSLLVRLPQRVLRDSVEITFRARLLENPTVFSAMVRNSAVAGVWQGVVPRDSEAEKVYVPAIYQRQSLLHNLACERVFTPNGDGINDTFELRVNVIRTERRPQVRLYTLAGAEVAELIPPQGGGQPLVYVWDGRDPKGGNVPPGLYLLRLRLETDASSEELTRLVCVAY
ncbi:MAG: gliding motility-associated C-terminal domain-containing protein [Candidatus Latescibacteria bacterium]|nr:gliding motility-associated C-terminal domain-containing protein [Candidatus Latescibacterota bacterium]